MPPPPIPQPPADPATLAALLESSRPRRALQTLRPGALTVFLGLTIVVQLLPLASETKVFVQTLLWASFIGLLLQMAVALRQARSESADIDSAEDMLVLKRYHDVVAMLKWRLSLPMRTEQSRLRALVLLATALARQGLHEESLVLVNALIDDERIAGPAAVMVRLSRAMSMLMSDHLYDADRAINDLRRQLDRGQTEVGIFDGEPVQMPADTTAIAMLRLLELYRDVKTGHAEESVGIFEQNLELLRNGLSHRVGDAHALVAIAYDRLGQADTARQRFADGTALQPIADLLRRYPELASIVDKYPVTPAPAKFAA